MLNEFFAYWTEKSENGKKMRFEFEKVFDVKRRLVTWNKRNKNINNGKQNNRPTTEDLHAAVEYGIGLAEARKNE